MSQKNTNKRNSKKACLIWAVSAAFVLGGIFIALPVFMPGSEKITEKTAEEISDAGEVLQLRQDAIGYEEAPSQENDTALVQAPEIPQALIEDTVSDGEDGMTPLMLAAASGENLETVRGLLESGADVNAADIHGRTPLIWAARYNHNPEILQILIEHGADVSTADHAEWTSLIWAARSSENPEVLRILIEHGADFNAADAAGWNSLIWAIRGNSNPEILQTLIEHSADINAASDDGFTPLMHAAASSSTLAIMQILLEGGSDVLIKDNNGRTALYHAERNEALRGTEAYYLLREKTLDSM